MMPFYKSNKFITMYKNSIYKRKKAKPVQNAISTKYEVPACEEENTIFLYVQLKWSTPSVNTIGSMNPFQWNIWKEENKRINKLYFSK